MRQFLQVERVLLLRFESDLSGSVAFESVDSAWPPMLGRRLFDPCFAKDYVEHYRQGRIHAVTNVNAAELSECYVQFLTPFQVKANLVVPIL